MLTDFQDLSNINIERLIDKSCIATSKACEMQEEVSTAKNAIGQLGGRIKTITAVDSFAAGVPRTAVVVSKIKATPRQYPRLPGRPNKQPL